jgi:outer membrane protein TolC
MFKLVFIIVAFIASRGLNAGALTLDDYLGQLETQNQGYVATQKNVEAGKLRSKEGEMPLAYTFFTNMQYINDKRESNFAFVTGDRNTMANLAFGFSKTTTFGLTAALSYNVNYFYYNGANPAFLTNSQFYQHNPQLDLKQSFWQNAFGRQTRANVQAIEARNLSSSYSESYRARSILAEAETLYWRLSLQRDLIKIQKDNFARAEKLRDWAKRRASLNLADKSDFLQAEANLKMRQLDLTSSMDEEKAIVRQFNTTRGVDSDELNEDLEIIPVSAVIALTPPERKGDRDDVKALKEAAKASAANARLARDRNAPMLDLFANLSLNGRDPGFNSSFKESFGGSYPYTIVGLKFSTPLDFGNIGRINSGYETEKIAAEYSYQRKQFESDRDWDNLKKKMDEYKERLKIANELEDLQNKKYQHEQQRHQKGQTTTYQVLTFEQDYANAQQMRLKYQGDILQLVAQMKTFMSKEEL